MKLIKEPISIADLKSFAQNSFGDLVKAVIDVQKQVLVVNAELHSDEERMLIELGSLQKNLWGINLYPDKFQTDSFIEYDSMINLRPQDNNVSRGVENKMTREVIEKIVNKLVTT